MSELRTRWLAMPRATRWAVMAGAFIALYFVVIEPTLELTASVSARADAIQAGLERQRERLSGRSESSAKLALATAQFGDPLPPGGADRSGALNGVIEGIFRERAVSALSIKARAPVAFGRGAFADVVPEGQEVRRLILDVEFEAAPEVAMEVIADLEKAREVASVGRIILRRLDRDGARRVQVSLSPEAWIITPKGGTR